MAEMDREKFTVRRAQIALQIYENLFNNRPKDCIEIDMPDSIGAIGVDYGEEGYILIQVEDGTLV